MVLNLLETGITVLNNPRVMNVCLHSVKDNIFPYYDDYESEKDSKWSSSG
jgi:hypothetical protein